MIGANVQISFQGSSFQYISDIVLEAAIGCDIILSDIDGRFAQLKILRSKSEKGFLDFYIRHILHLKFHACQSDRTGSLYMFILFLFYIRKTAGHLHIGIDRSIQLHITEWIHLFDHT